MKMIAAERRESGTKFWEPGPFSTEAPGHFGQMRRGFVKGPAKGP
jgi:hypothetical protein